MQRLRSCRRLLSTRAIVCDGFGPPSVMQMRDGVTLRGPENGEVLIHMRAAGVNPSDTYVRLGPEGPYAGNAKLIPDLPFTPGKDGAGVVESVGAGVTGAKVGDRVYVSGSLTGTYAEHCICSANQVYPLPANVSFEEGACVGVPCATAYRALFLRGSATSGENVFVHGASGAVGLAAIQMAVDAGCFVVGSAGTAAGEDAVRASGAHAVVNHRDEHYVHKALDALKNAESQDGFDLLLEMAADKNLVADMAMMRRGGRIAIVGSKALPTSLNPRLTMPKEIDVRGVFLGNASALELQNIHSELFKRMESGSLKPVVGKILPLDQAPVAHAEVMDPPEGGSLGNIVLSAESGSSL